MHIVHIVTRLLRAGTERNLAHFLDWQIARGHHVSVVTGTAPDRGLLPGGVAVTVVKDLVRPLDVFCDTRALHALRTLLRTEQPDIVHTHQSKAGILGRLAANPETQVVLHSIHMASFGRGYGWASLALRFAERICARRSDLIISVGEELREEYIQAGVGRREQFRVQRSPVGVERFLKNRALRPDDRAVLRVKWDLSSSHSILLAVGALEKRKRHALLITQLQPLLARGGIMLLIAGSGPKHQELEAVARERGVEGCVRLLGHVEKVEELCALADVFVHTSAVEGVPQVAVQSLAAGLPVVATDVHGLREIADHGMLVVNADGTGLREAVEGVLANPPPAPDRSAFDTWTLPRIEEGIVALHDEINVLARAKQRLQRQ